GIGVVRAVVVAEVAAVDRRAAQLEQLLAVPSIAAHERGGDAQLAGLPRDEADVVVVAGNVDGLRRGTLDGGELAPEVGAALGVGLPGDDLPAHLRELAL